MDFKKEFEGKKVTVLGLGLLGRGVGDTQFLAECGAELIVTDLKTEVELRESLEKLKGFSNITYVLGEHRLEDFRNRDFILKAAGVPLDSPYVLEAKKNNIPVRMSAALFAKLSGIPMVGVTGTRGKSTVTHMIHHVLKESVEGEGTILGGNIRGISNLQLLKDVSEESIGVFELDSWQLQGFGEEKISPQVAVFTNFMSDHLNYYLRASERNSRTPSDIFERGTEASSAYKEATDAYFEDKAQIFLHQEVGDVLITTPEVFREAQTYAKKHSLTLRGEVALADISVIPDDVPLVMPGMHNRLNAALAVEALRALSFSDEQIFAGLATFRGVPGRLEFMGERKGVKIVNDNNATTPEATVEGLRAVADGKNVVLIMGGADKGLLLDTLLQNIQKYAKHVVMLPGTGTERMRESMPDATYASSLAEAINSAFANAENGDIILFSPAFASFGMFKNEYDRNDQFVAHIAKLP